MAEKEPTWIYAADGGAKIVELARDEGAPDGWSRDINVIEDPAKRTADAISGVQPPVVYGADLDIPAPGEEADIAFELRAAKERIAELEVIIQGGSAENERMQAELSTADEMMERAGSELDGLKAQAEAFAAVEKGLRDQIAHISAELNAEREKNAPLGATIARLECDVASVTADRDRLKAKRSER